ncbi:MAG: hypothetical protein LBS94_05200 [Prevotellaceae bacterium]|jgi:hypothetical protein|nr:hypothetical protein [Prevotellaceae bacterium]
MKIDRIVGALGEAVRSNQVGIYVTIIFHLCVAIALMSAKIYSVPHTMPLEISFDFQDDELKKLALLAQKKVELEAEVNQLLRQARSEISDDESSPRNAAVNEDWRSENVEHNRAMEENDEVQKRIDATRRMMEQSRSSDAEGDVQAAPKEAVKKQDLYTGPSVLSYMLKGRTAISLPLPVYKCESGGEVVVLIEVAPHGTVVATSVEATKPETDNCIQEAARRAAMLSRFTTSSISQNQQGSITYRFVAQ